MTPFFLGTAPYIPYGIFETIEKYTLQTDDCKGAFAKCLDIHSLSELELLVQEGHTNDRLYWIESGLVRSFSGTDTDDITTGLYQEGDFFCAFSCFFLKNPPRSLSAPKNPLFCFRLALQICSGFLACTRLSATHSVVCTGICWKRNMPVRLYFVIVRP